jgi:LmbE family N-acetylglucosaminyl deacetylase
MIVGAHHDDNDLAGGTLAHYRRAGWKIVSVVVTDGRYIDDVVSTDHIAIREKESLAAAELLGMSCEFLRIPEGTFTSDGAARHALLHQIRRHRPKLLITHPRTDYHRDHEQVSHCVQEAVGQCWNPCVDCDGLAPCERPYLYWRDSFYVPQLEPDEYVDVTDTMDIKLRMIQCHLSQQPAERCEGDIIDLVTVQSRFRGAQAGVRYAEAYRLVPQRRYLRCGKLLSAVRD